MVPPRWAVVCRAAPHVVHCRNDGHRCIQPVVTCPLCYGLGQWRDPMTDVLGPCPACAPDAKGGG
jgi:hypothetical protein